MLVGKVNNWQLSAGRVSNNVARHLTGLLLFFFFKNLSIFPLLDSLEEFGVKSVGFGKGVFC